MAINMLIHDTRLAGYTPSLADNQWGIDGTYPIEQVVGWTATVARGAGGLKKLIVMAHGYESGGHGGFGIQLGKEGLTLATVDRFSALKGLVKSIILYSCAVAETAPGRRMTDGDGGLLIARLAARTQAYVVASSALQYYYAGTSGISPIDFGTWEGDVYLFGPSGNKRLIDWGWIPDVIE
jgi:hypothetical protein